MFGKTNQTQKKMNQLQRYKKVYSSTQKNFHPSFNQRASYFSKFKAIIDRNQQKWKIENEQQKNPKFQIKTHKQAQKIKPFTTHNIRQTKIKTCSNLCSQKNILMNPQPEYQQTRVKRKSQNIQLTTLISKPKNDVSVNRHDKNIINYQQFVIAGQPSSNGHLWGKMQISETLGSGAYGLVKSGIFNGSKYAIKVYEKYKLIDQKKRKRVYTQIALLKNLGSHQNVINMYQALQDKTQIHMIMQYIPESTTLLQYFRSNFLRLEISQIKLIFSKIVAGVAYLHQNGIAHRDIKPQNVLFHKDDQGDINLKIIDFGFATKVIKTDLQCGTPNFMAPEIFIKFEKHDPKKSDIWALGVTLFYLCQGRYPFKGFDERNLLKLIKQGKYEVKKTVDQDILDILSKTLVISPNQRISIKELLDHPFICTFI